MYDLSQRAKDILGSWQAPGSAYQKTFKEFGRWQAAHTKKYSQDIPYFEEVARFLAGAPAPAPTPAPAPGPGTIGYTEPGPVQIPIPPAPAPITPPAPFQPTPWPATPMPAAPAVMTSPAPPAPITLTPPPTFAPTPYQEKPFAEYTAQAQAQYGPLAEAARRRLQTYQKERGGEIIREMAARNILPSGLTQENLERLAGDVGEQLAQVELESQGLVGQRAGELQTQEFGRYMGLREQDATDAAQRFSQWATTTGMDVDQQQQLFANQMAQAGFSQEESQRAFSNALNIRQQGFTEYTTQREMGLAENAQSYQQWATTTGMSIDQAQAAFQNAMAAQGFNQQEIQRVWENERRKLEFEKTQSLQEKLAKMGYAQQAAELGAQQQYWGAQLAQQQREWGGLSAWQQAQLDLAQQKAGGGAGGGYATDTGYGLTTPSPGPGKLGQAVSGRLGTFEAAPTPQKTSALGKAGVSALTKAKGKATAKAAIKAPYGLASAAAQRINTGRKIARI